MPEIRDPNIEAMTQPSRAKLYKDFMVKASSLGHSLQQYKRLYRKSTKSYWITKLNDINREIGRRDSFFSRAKRLSASLNKPMRLETKEGTNAFNAKREYDRLRKIELRKEKRERDERIKQQSIFNRKEKNFNKIIKSKLDNIRTESVEQVISGLNNLLEYSLLKENRYYTIYHLNLTIINEHISQINKKLANESNNGRLIIKIKLESNEIIYRPTSYNGLYLRTLFKNRTEILKLTTNYQEYDELTFDDVKDIKLELVSSKKKNTEGKSGGFFNRVKKEEYKDIDTNRYQIYTENEINQLHKANKEEYADIDHCIIQSLKCNNIADAKIVDVMLALKYNQNLGKDKLKDIAKIIEYDIKLYTYDGNRIRNELIKCDVKDAPEDRGRIGSQDKVLRSAPVCNLALHFNHYFVYEETKYSAFSIQHYDETNGDISYNKLVNGKYYKIEKLKLKRLSSLDLLILMDKQGMFENSNMDKTIGAIAQSDRIISSGKSINYSFNDKDQREYNTRPRGKKKSSVETITYAADCEADVSGSIHKLLYIGYKAMDDYSEEVKILEAETDNHIRFTIYKWLNDMTNNGKNDVKCWFHNAKYDVKGLLLPYLYTTGICEKDNQLYELTCIYKKRKIVFKDSYKIISMPLSKFNKEFKLKYGKAEAINYEYHTIENKNTLINPEDYAEGLCEKDKKIFNKEKEPYMVKTTFEMDGMVDLDLLPESERLAMDRVGKAPWSDYEEVLFDHSSYYKNYLRLDVLTLRAGLLEFESKLKTIDVFSDLKLDNYLSISSIANDCFAKMGCYDGVYELSGQYRAYCNEAVRGGRVYCNPKYKKKLIENKIADLDACSLYPSAMDRIARYGGYPIGQAYELTDMDKWNEYYYSILSVEITKINKHRDQPFLCAVIDGKKEYSTEIDLPVTINISSIGLNDLIWYHDIEFKVVKGLYWNQGGNNKIGQAISDMYNRRRDIKKSNPALANVYKLIMNSSYGKLCQRQSFDKNKFLNYKDNQQRVDYIVKYYNLINKESCINDSTSIFNMKTIDSSFNRAHLGVMVLDMSKRIMMEVFSVIDELNVPVYYSDTDSIQTRYDDLDKIYKAFKNKYGRDLRGNGLGEFHNDYNLAGASGEIYGIKGIYLGKKAYLTQIVSENEPDLTDIHMKMKGVTQAGMILQTKNTIEGAFDMYKQLANNEEVKIQLNPSLQQFKDIDIDRAGAVKFTYGNGNISTSKPFYRTVKF